MTAAIVANGKPREIRPGQTIAGFLGELGWRPEWVVVEVNGEPVERSRFAEIGLNDGDRIEVVRAVAGGCA